MDKSRQGDLLIVRFADGEDLLGGMEKVLKEEGISSGLVVGGVGMLRNAGLSFYKGKGLYETVPVDGEAELCSLNGNISTLEGELVIHMHAVLGKRGGSAVAGHLSGGEINMTGEIAIMAVPQKLVRKMDTETGLRTLTFE